MAWLKRHLASWRVVGLLAILAPVLWIAGRGLPDGRLHVYFLDVGQGDAIFVLAPDGRQILIDGGPSPVALLSELGELMPFWDRSLDLVVLTHPDLDHMAGLLAALGRYRVATVLAQPQMGPDPEAQAWRDALGRAGPAGITPETDQRLAAGGLALTVLHAPASGPASTKSSNDDSIVLRLDYGETSFLLTGDAEEGAEAGLLASGLPLAASVLKAGHHGSNSSTSPAFLAAVAPRLVVIQVGADNRFGHPQPELLERLGGLPVLRTDLDGRVEIVSDGKELWLKVERKRAAGSVQGAQ